MEDGFVCKIASAEDMDAKWEADIRRRVQERDALLVWKQKKMEDLRRGYIIPYYGILNGEVICEATAMLRPEAVQNSTSLVDAHTAYLSAFRTEEEYQGKGYFSKLFRFMLEDLGRKGFVRVTLGVEPDEEKNKKIYAHYGFTEYIKSGREHYSDGTVIDVEYYGKSL